MSKITVYMICASLYDSSVHPCDLSDEGFVTASHKNMPLKEFEDLVNNNTEMDYFIRFIGGE